MLMELIKIIGTNKTVTTMTKNSAYTSHSKKNETKICRVREPNRLNTSTLEARNKHVGAINNGSMERNEFLEHNIPTIIILVYTFLRVHLEFFRNAKNGGCC